jgi:hypothetical protein
MKNSSGQIVSSALQRPVRSAQEPNFLGLPIFYEPIFRRLD